MMSLRIIPTDSARQAAAWVFDSPDAIETLRSDKVQRLLLDIMLDVMSGLPADVDALAEAIDGPRIVAEALAAFIEWRCAPPEPAVLQ